MVTRHWLPVTHAACMAEMARDLIEHAEGKPESEALQCARQHGECKPLCSKPTATTDAGGDVGRCAALELAEQGAAIVTADVHAEDAGRAAKPIRLMSGKAWVHTMDIGSTKQMEALVDQIDRELGGVDIVVNSAGIGVAGGIVDTSERG